MSSYRNDTRLLSVNTVLVSVDPFQTSFIAMGGRGGGGTTSIFQINEELISCL